MISAFVNRPDRDPNIGIVERVAYGMGDFSSQLILTPVSMLFLYYATEFVNINISIVGGIMLASRVFDGFSDLFVGYLIEKTKSPYGKTRVWIWRMLIPYFLCGIAIFSVPESLPDLAKYIYIFIVYNLTITVVYTSINLPYGALSAKRSVLVIFRMLGATAGGTLVMMATLPLVKYFGNDQTAWTITAAIFSGIATLGFFFTFYFCHERVISAPMSEEKGNTVRAIKKLFKNSYWVMLSIAMLLVCAADIVSGTANTYYCRYFLGDDTLIGNFSAVSNTCKVIAMIVVVPLMLKFLGKRNSLIIACLLIVGANFSRLINPYSVELSSTMLSVVSAASALASLTPACLP